MPYALRKRFFKRLLLFFLIVCMINLHAKSYLFSPLPPAHQQIIKTEPCSLECLKDLMLQNQIFSFVSQYDNNNQDESLKTYYKDILNKLNPVS
ncbi:hypothetical protein ACQJ7L_07945, partial [Helicobacter pylori]